MTKRVLIWCTAVLSALLIGTIVTVSVLIATVNHRSVEADYRACMERLDPGYQAGTGVEEYTEKLVRNAEFCDG